MGYADGGYVDPGYWDQAASGPQIAPNYTIVVESKPLMFGRTGLMECIKLYEQSSNPIGTNLADDQDLPVTDATVLLTMVDQNQEEVEGEAWPQTLSNLGNGFYGVVLPKTLSIFKGENYWVRINSNSPTKGDHYQEVLAICLVNRR